jgi:hypothetical protein
MRRFRRFVTTLLVAGVTVWAMRSMGSRVRRRSPALRHFVTYRFDPLVTRLGLVGGRRSPWASIEHVGRTSGIVRRSPVLPRIIGGEVFIPLTYGRAAHWIRNVQAAGHCRMQLHEMLYELDEPIIVAGRDLPGLPPWRRALAARSSREYVRLHVYLVRPGRLTDEVGDVPGVTGAVPAAASAPADRRVGALAEA